MRTMRARGINPWTIDLPAGAQIADSHPLYDAVQRADPLALPAVTAHMRGSLVTQVDLAGRAYQTTAVSSREAWIEAVILLALCLLTLVGLVRMVRRATRARRPVEAG